MAPFRERARYWITSSAHQVVHHSHLQFAQVNGIKVITRPGVTDADRSGHRSIARNEAAAGGALFRAWLGFHATEGLFALITSIVGGAVGANLILLALDIAWDRPGV